jgi:uncharacterized protein YwqG
MTMNKQDVHDWLLASELAQAAPTIESLLKESVRLKSRPADENQIGTGDSKLGGRPDLPPETPWPEWRGAPMSFVAQVRLAGLAPCPPAALLPQAGWLSFFYDAEQQTFGVDSEDRGGWRVFYFTDATHLERRPAPATLPLASQFKPSAVEFATELTLPSHLKVYAPGRSWTPREQDVYADFLFQHMTDRTTPQHRLLGHADAIQDDMRLGCQLAANGARSLRDPGAAALEPGAAAWQLLFQVDSDTQPGFRWGTAGMIYYWMPGSALVAHDFGAAWLMLQCE